LSQINPLNAVRAAFGQIATDVIYIKKGISGENEKLIL
jgi:hypothetical protein